MLTISHVPSGHFDQRSFAIIESMAPNTIRVYAGDPGDDDIVCVIGNLLQHPTASWGLAWTDKDPGWKARLTAIAVRDWRAAIIDSQVEER